MALGILDKIPIYPIFYLLKGDYIVLEEKTVRTEAAARFLRSLLAKL